LPEGTLFEPQSRQQLPHLKFYEYMYQESLQVSAGVLFQKLTVAELDNKFPASYGSRSFIMAFGKSHHWTLIQSQLNPIHTHTSPSGYHTTLCAHSHLYHACEILFKTHHSWYLRFPPSFLPISHT